MFESAPWLGDVLRVILVLLALGLGTALILQQRRIAKIEAEAKKVAADAELQKQLNEKLKLENPPPGGAGLGATPAAPDASGVLSELVKGLSSSAPLLAGGIVLYILAGVLLGSLSVSVSTSVGNGSETSQTEEQ